MGPQSQRGWQQILRGSQQVRSAGPIPKERLEPKTRPEVGSSKIPQRPILIAKRGRPVVHKTHSCYHVNVLHSLPVDMLPDVKLCDYDKTVDYIMSQLHPLHLATIPAQLLNSWSTPSPLDGIPPVPPLTRSVLCSKKKNLVPNFKQKNGYCYLYSIHGSGLNTKPKQELHCIRKFCAQSFSGYTNFRSNSQPQQRTFFQPYTRGT